MRAAMAANSTPAAQPARRASGIPASLAALTAGSSGT